MPINGTSADDSLDGTIGQDTINGFGGDDTLKGDAGDDSITGDVGADIIDGGAGDDTIVGGAFVGDIGVAGLEVLYGAAGDDIIYSASNSKEVVGLPSQGTSHYYVVGGAGNDSLVGNTGNEIFLDGAGRDTIIGGGGHDVYIAGDEGRFSFPDLNIVSVLGPIFLERTGNTIIDGNGDTDQLIGIELVGLYGGDDNDVLINNTANNQDVISGFDGDDFIYLNGSADNVLTSEIGGGAGSDTLVGGTFGRNIFRLDDGDIVAGGGSPDTFDLGQFHFGDKQSTAITVIDFGVEAGSPITALEFVMIAVFDGSGSRVTLDSSAFNVSQLDPFRTEARIDADGDGNPDYRIIFYGLFDAPLEFNAEPALLTNNITMSGSNHAEYILGAHDADSLVGGGAREILFGFGGADVISGGNGGDALTGNEGADTLDGGAGNDLLDGGDDHDVIFAQSGRDTVIGGAGNDHADGGADNDLIFAGGDNDTVIGDAGDDTLKGEDGNDRLFAGLGDDRADGGFGDDFARTSNGRDTLLGGDGNDTLGAGSGGDHLNGGLGPDMLLASNGADRLYGGDGGDTLQGGNGRDTLSGGAGNDRLVGGAHNDRFNFAPGSGADVIVDFAAGAASGDVIGLIGFGAAFDDFADVLAASSQVGANVVIDLGGGDTITLQGVTLGNLNADDFAFG